MHTYLFHKNIYECIYIYIYLFTYLTVVCTSSGIGVYIYIYICRCACNVDLDVGVHVHLHACVYLFICICTGPVGKGARTKAQPQPMHHWQFRCDPICRSELSSRTPWRQDALKGLRGVGPPPRACADGPWPRGGGGGGSPPGVAPLLSSEFETANSNLFVKR